MPGAEGIHPSPNVTLRRLVMLALVMAASIGIADAQRRPRVEPDCDAFCERGPDSFVHRSVTVSRRQPSPMKQAG